MSFPAFADDAAEKQRFFATKTPDRPGFCFFAGASDGNRTRVSTLARLRSTIELRLRMPLKARLL